jgi:hypothetical protein
MSAVAPIAGAQVRRAFVEPWRRSDLQNVAVYSTYSTTS